MKKKLNIIMLICGLLYTLPVFAANYKIVEVSKNAETKYLENDQGYINKKISSIDEEKGEVIIDLTINNKKKNSSKVTYKNTEVYVIISSETKADDIKNMASKLLSKENIKVGVIQIVGTKESSAKGSSKDASVIVKATDNITDFNSQLDKNIVNYKTYANVQAALLLAKNTFSDDVNKFLVMLDVTPLVIEGTISEISYKNYHTEEEIKNIMREHTKVFTTGTKKTLLSLADKNINLIMLRPSDKIYNFTLTGTDITIDGSSYVQDLYGTIENPTYGIAYDSKNITSYDFLSNKVSEEVLSTIPDNITNITLTDYFPTEIVENFDFSYVKKPTTGTISSEIKDNNIVYKVDKLQGNDSITISYKLKLKDNVKTDLLGKEILTNEKVTLNYTDINNKNYEVTQTSSPSIKLMEVLNDMPDTNLNQSITIKIIGLITLVMGTFIIGKTLKGLKHN